MSGIEFIAISSDPLLHVLSYLDYTDLVSCLQTCHRLRELASEESLWKTQCFIHWMEKWCPEDRTWKLHFIDWFKNFGKYVCCYKTIRTAWNQIEKYTEQYCPNIFQSFKGGATETELDLVESKCHENLPLDLRCSYRIHNGQILHTGDGVGLLGNMAISGHRSHSFKSEHLLEIQKSAEYYCDSGEVHGCLPITFCPRSRISQFIAICEDGGYLNGQIFYPCNSTVEDGDKSTLDSFISASSFTEWLTKYAQELEDDIFPRFDGDIYRFFHEPKCVAVSGYVKVTAATAFIPEMSSINEPEFFFTYHITMTMDKSVSQSESCQLETREWTITDADGDEEHVEGPGVVGEFPLMKPGSTFSWTSCTTFKTTYGNMRGIFRMRKCSTGDEVVVECPCFHMKCLPYQTSADRREKRRHNKKNN